MTGEGAVTPDGIDGKLSVAPLPKPVQPVTVQIGGQPADVQYAGAAPGLVAGLMQVNAVVPQGAPAGNDVPVTIAVASQVSPPVTIAIR